MTGVGGGEVYVLGVSVRKVHGRGVLSCHLCIHRGKEIRVGDSKILDFPITLLLRYKRKKI